MKCYYEILEVSREAEDNEIKTAYRKLALKWHPDKNIDNTEVAKEQFQLVQQAYEVLSDRQERAWYDNHREQILRGSDSNFKDDCLDVFPYFTTQCFRGYGDDEKGFYTVYRKVFEQIAKEDIEYMDSKSDYDEIPTFGNSNSDYEDIVGPFYAYWMSYSTRKSYVWLDPYNINETRERRVLKLIEKENKKVRQKAKKERNEEIRNLVAFVRKRDKRMQAYAKQLETKNVENRQKQEQLRKQKLIERKKELHNDKAQAEWSKFDNVQRELKEIEKNLAAQFGECISDSDSNSVDDECDDLYCVACNKVFKNPKAFANHESSKKHRENVEKLKLLVREEEEQYEDISENEDSDVENLSESEEEVEQSSKKKNISPSQKEDSLEEINELSDTETKEEDFKSDSEETVSQSSKKKKNKKNKKVMQIQDSDEEIPDLSDTEQKDEMQSDSEETVSQSSKKKSKKNKKVIRIAEHTGADSNDEINGEINITNGKPVISDDDFNFGSSKKQKKKNAKLKPTQNNAVKKDNEETNNTETTINIEENMKTKNTKTKNANKKTKINKNNKDSIDLEDVDVSHCCVTCKSNFNSKNKLFDHLKKTGHSVLLPQKTPKSRKKQVK